MHVRAVPNAMTGRFERMMLEAECFGDERVIGELIDTLAKGGMVTLLRDEGDEEERETVFRFSDVRVE
jgi:hypothetical protein